MSSKRKRKEPEEDHEQGAPAWMATFADMMTLLMTFFILIMSFSTMELDKFKMAMGSLKGALGVLGVQKQLSTNQSWFSPSEPTAYTLRQKSILDHMEKLQQVVKANELEDKVEVSVSEGELYVQIKDGMLFDSGKADLKPNYLKLLSIIASTALKDALEIRVEGHTDNIPIKSNLYPSNWHLSVARALSVLKYFVTVEGIEPTKLAAAGHGEHQPLVQNSTVENRAKNRRVVLRIKI